MAFKINIRPDIEREMEVLLAGTTFRSKTEYINVALADFNKRLRREEKLNKLKKYFQSSAYQQQSKELMKEFHRARKIYD